MSQSRTLCLLYLINSKFLIKLKSGRFLGQCAWEIVFGLLGDEFCKLEIDGDSLAVDHRKGPN